MIAFLKLRVQKAILKLYTFAVKIWEAAVQNLKLNLPVSYIHRLCHRIGVREELPDELTLTRPLAAKLFTGHDIILSDAMAYAWYRIRWL